MRKQGIDASAIIASGGIVKSAWIGQVIADTFALPVKILGEAEEGSAYGAALMAMYGHRSANTPGLTWQAFLDEMRPEETGRVFIPIGENIATLDRMFATFCDLVEVEPALLEMDWAG